MHEARILVVDDNLMDARLCQLLLDRHEFKVTSTTDPRIALELLQQQKMDLLLVDIYLPHIDGFELIARAKTYQPTMAVLVMTGFATIETGIQALQRGVDGLILKPFENGERLIDAVQQALLSNRHKEDSARLQVLRPLFSVTEGLIAETDPEQLNQLILSAAENLFQNSCICIYRYSVDKDDLTCLAASENAMDYSDSDSDFIRSLLHLSELEGAFFVNDETDEYASWRSMLDEQSRWSFLVAPVRQETTHFLFVAGRPETAQQFSESDLELFVLLARQAAIAVLNAGLYEELRTTIKQVEESQRALVQAEKMAVVGRLIASVAHEINNPLQGVGNCLHLAGRKDLDYEQRDAYLKMGKEELERLTLIVRQMLDYYRLDHEVRETCDLKELVDRTLELLKAQLSEHSIKVLMNMKQPLPPLPMAKNQMQQVIVNLLLNAIDAVTYNGSSRTIWIDACMKENQLLLSVEDNGPGIAAELEQQIFEPFFSTKPDGMGLGLMVSYEIMEAHGGMLELVPPIYGKGAKFRLSLPYGV
jgi:signal transduction histidine kinase/CheY-like chemotaxis protein